MDNPMYKDPEIASSDAQSAHEDGTVAQSQLGKARARHNFFASLDATVAEAVKSDAERVQYTEEEEVSTCLRQSCRMVSRC